MGLGQTTSQEESRFIIGGNLSFSVELWIIYFSNSAVEQILETEKQKITIQQAFGRYLGDLLSQYECEHVVMGNFNNPVE